MYDFESIIDNVRRHHMSCTDATQHYALFFRRGRIGWWEKLAMDSNRSVDSGRLASMHAEHLVAIKFARMNNFRRFLSGCEKVDIVVIRLSRLGIVGYSRPCKNCITRLMRCNIIINNIYYTDSDGSIKVEKFSTMYDSPLTIYSSGDRQKMKKNLLTRMKR